MVSGVVVFVGYLFCSCCTGGKENEREQPLVVHAFVCSLTLSLNSCLSSMVSVSALAMTGTMLTIFPNLFMNSMSMGRNLETDFWSVWTRMKDYGSEL